MRKILRIILPVVITGLLFSCTSSLFYQLATNNITPETSNPIVHSLTVENAIYISWNKDEGAEEYFLYRSTQPDGVYTKVYNGTALEYLDNNVVIKIFYYYKLAKKRGNYMTDKSDYVIGVCEKNKKDNYEENNIREQSKLMDDINECNIFYYIDDLGNRIEDRDWFYVILNPNKKLTIKFLGLIPENSLDNEYICINVNDGATHNIVNNEEIKISNTANIQKKIYFQITVNTDMFLGTPSATGGAIGSYQIKYVQENL